MAENESKTLHIINISIPLFNQEKKSILQDCPGQDKQSRFAYTHIQVATYKQNIFKNPYNH